MPTEIPRTHGKFGLIYKPKPDGLSYLDELLINPLPKAPGSRDNTCQVTDWGMLGNDTKGDCVEAGRFHLMMLDALNAMEAAEHYTAGQVVGEYLELTGGADNGLCIQTVLQTWVARGLTGGKLDSFAPLHATNLPEVKSGIDAFRGLMCGVQVPSPAISQFDAHKPWDLTGTRADDDIIGAHCIVPAKFDAKHLGVITWGKVQPVTPRWWERYAVEAWACITREFLAAKPGVINVAQLRSEISALENAA